MTEEKGLPEMVGEYWNNRLDGQTHEEASKNLMSGLPPLEKIREESTMRIITISTAQFDKKRVETSLMVSKTHTERHSQGSWAPVGAGCTEPGPLIATLMRIDDERIKGFMPSKVWARDPLDMEQMWLDPEKFPEINFSILYYINSTMPQAVKPFKDNTYLMFFIPDDGDEINYDVNIRFFMDQVMVPNLGMAYVVMIGDEAYKDIVVKELQ